MYTKLICIYKGDGDSASNSSFLAYAFTMWLKHKMLVEYIDVISLLLL